MDLCLKGIFGIIQDIYDYRKEHILAAAHVMAEQIRKDRLICILGPGGHSNPAVMEIFFHAGGLMHASAMLGRDTIFSCGVLKPMQTKRLPGFDRIIVDDYRIGEGDLLIVISACGVSSATIDTVLQAKENDTTVIGVSSHEHVENCSEEHLARHPSKKSLHEVAGHTMDCKVRLGDVAIELPDSEQKIGALSTFASAYVLNSMVIETINVLNDEGIKPPIWMSGNAPGGDERNSRLMQGFRDKVRCS